MRARTIGFHDVTDDLSVSRDHSRPGLVLYALTSRGFRSHLEAIREQGVRVTTVDQPESRKGDMPVFLTFDDGALGSYTWAADELEKNGWRGHFFIVTDWIGRPGFLDSRMIRHLRERGHVVGTHTCSHPARMSHLHWPDLVKEWSESCLTLSNILGEPVRVGSVPNGCYTHKVGRAAATAGIKVLFTSEPTVATTILDGCVILGRYSIRRDTTPAVSGAVAAGRTWPRWRQTLLWKAKKPVKVLGGESFLAFRRYLISRFVVQATTYPQRSQSDVVPSDTAGSGQATHD